MQYSNQISKSVTTSQEIAPERAGYVKRTQLIITNSGANAVTITKGNVAAIANIGIIIQPNGTYIEASDGGYLCWQGAVQAVSTAGTTLSIVESFQVY
jgi:hypothetical protein